MPENGQYPMFYEGIMDALNKTVNGNPKGLSIKQIAMDLWPSRNAETARSVLSRALSEENRDVNLNPEELDKIMEITGAPEHIIFCLCDEYGFERPARKDKATFEREMKGKVIEVQATLQSLLREMKKMEGMK